MNPTPIRTPVPLEIVRADIPALSKHWGFVRKGLLKIRRNVADATWIPEQIRGAMQQGMMGQGGAETFFCFRADKIVGFYVMLPQVDPWTQTPLFWLLWLIYAAEPIWDRVMPEIEKQARERGCTGIDYITSLPDLLEKGKKFGYERVSVTARKRLEY